MGKLEEVGRANEATVKALMDHLLEAFNQFLDAYPGELPYIDAFMGAHNFHVVVILDIEKRLKSNPAQQIFFRQMATDTFRMALENKPPFKQEKPGGL